MSAKASDLFNTKTPVTGMPATGGTSIYSPGGKWVGGGTLQTTTGEQKSGGNSTSDTTKRVGDWIYKGGGQWAPVTNSETDITRKLRAVYNMSPKQNLSIGDVIGAATGGATTSMITRGLTKKFLGSVSGPLGIIAGVTDFFSTLSNVDDQYRQAWLNQDIDYDVAADRIVNKDGSISWKLNYDKMKGAGYGSGELVRQATDTTNTKAMILGDNKLSIDASPVFASSERFSELVKRIKDYFPNLTVEQANSVADEETGKTYLDMINDTVKQEENQFYYNAQSIENLKSVAPTASSKALEDAVATQTIGYISGDSKTLSNVDITVYNEKNEKETVNAKAYLDSIKNMGKNERNDYIVSIGNRLEDASISDDEKAVLKAQANALYAASDNDGEYKDMVKKDFFDSVAEAPIPRIPIPGLAEATTVLSVIFPNNGSLWNFALGASTGVTGQTENYDKLKWHRLDAFSDDDLRSSLIRASFGMSHMFNVSKVTNSIEESLRNVTGALGEKLGGSAGSALTKLATSENFAPKFAWQVAADMPIELARSLVYGTVGEKFDFWDEARQDIFFDLLFSLGPKTYADVMSMPKYEYRRYKGDTSREYESDNQKTTDEMYDGNVKDLEEDEFDMGEDLSPKGVGIREDAGLVEITGEELAKRHAERILKHSNKVTLKVMELFHDKNAAQARVALMIKAAGGSSDDFRKAVMYSGDIKNVSKLKMNEFLHFRGVSKDYKEMGEKLLAIIGEGKDLSQDDINYINASANRHRFLAENKGDKEAEKDINRQYNKYIEKVGAERAAMLDEAMTAMRKVVSNVLDFYVEKGLMSEAEVKKMRNSPAYKNGMFLPIWSKGAGVNGKWGNEIGQGRAKTKKVFNKDELIAVEDLEHPLVSLSQYIDNAMRNVALNDKAIFFRDMASKYPQMEMHLYADTGDGLKEVKNLKEINKDFAKKYDNIVAKVKQEYPTHQGWMKQNEELVLGSDALSKTERLSTLKSERAKLQRRLRKLEKAQNDALTSNVNEPYVNDSGVRVKDVKIGDSDVPVDVEIADQVAQLSALGVEVVDSSSGIRADRDNKKGVSGGYIKIKADELSDDAKDVLFDASNKAGMEFSSEGNYEDGRYFTFTQSANKRTDAQRKKSWNTFFDEIGVSKDPIDVPKEVEKVRELYNKYAEAKKAENSIDQNADPIAYGEAKAKTSAEYAKYLVASRKVANAVETGNIVRGIVERRENIDDMLVLDPEITRKINELRTPFKTLGDAITKFKLVEGPTITGDFKLYIMDALMESMGKGTRKVIGNAPRRTAQMTIRDIITKVGDRVDAKFGNVVDRLFDADKVQKYTEEAVEEVLKEELSEAELETVLKVANEDRKLERKMVLDSREKHLKTFEAAKQRISDLGISASTTVYETPDVANSPTAKRAYGYYNSNGGAPLTSVYGLNGEQIKVTTDDSAISLVLSNFENAIDPSLDIQTTIIHEYAHAAFDRANNRVPILMDIIRMIKPDLYDKPLFIEQVANSRDATELVAYVTQKKFADEMNGRKSTHWENDETVQRHLDSLLDNLGFESEDFTAAKKSMMNLIKCAFTFVKAKLVGKLRSVDTFDDFYRGLVSGAFATEMRISSVGTKITDLTKLYNFRWNRVEGPDGVIEYRPERFQETNSALEFRLTEDEYVGLKMAVDIQDIKDQIDANGAEQARLTDEIKESARQLLLDAQKLAKGSPIELDIDSFVDVELTNALKKALKSNNAAGQIQNILAEAVQKANPYTSRNSVIRARTAEAAERFRKNLNAHMAFKNAQAKKKMGAAKVNAIADQVMDKVTEKVTGRRNKVSAINDAELTRILNSGGDGHTVRYMVDGKEQRYVLTGPGSEEFVKEFYAPEFTIKGPFAQRLLNISRKIANAKRYWTTSTDPTRVLPNLVRDWSRGIVTTGGDILLSPDDLRTEALDRYQGDKEATEKIDDGFRLAQENQEGSTFTQSMLVPKKNRPKSMIRSMKAEDGNAYTRFKAKTTGEKLSLLQDSAEEFTRNRAMEVAYYKTLADAAARGLSVDDAIKEAINAAYFAGREATTNFSRRGKLIATIAQNVPYLSQKFATLESFKYAYLDNPIAVGRSLKATVGAYAALIAIALSNDESRKKYYLLTEYDRANNIIIPLANDTIMTIPLDETIAAFLTPYRRMIETLNGVDPEAFYLWGAEFLEALSPLDLTGFSEGDKFNVVRGFQKLGSQLIPTWAMPFLEAATGTDWYYGSTVSVDEQYVGSRTGNFTPTAGELTTKSNNSRLLAAVSDGTGIPQWILQRFVQQYGGNVGQYVINGLDKLSGATDEAQGGKDFFDSIFKPFTGMDSDQASQAFWDGVRILEDRKKNFQNELRTLNNKIASTAGEEKAQLQKERQEKISKYGTDVTDFISQYLSAYEITGGLTKQQANRIYYLFNLYGQDKSQEALYPEGSIEEYFADKADSAASDKATNLAAGSGIDQFYQSHNGITDYDTSYAMSALKNTVYGVPTQQMVDIANILEDTSDYANSFTKLRSDAKKARREAYSVKNYDLADKIAYEYDYKILAALYPYLVENGIAETLNRNAVINYLQEWILVPSSEMRTSKGRYVPNLGQDAQKEKAFVKQFVKKMYGVAGE